MPFPAGAELTLRLPLRAERRDAAGCAASEVVEGSPPAHAGGDRRLLAKGRSPPSSAPIVAPTPTAHAQN